MNRNLGYSNLVTVPIAAQAAGTTIVYGTSQFIGAGSFSGVRYVAALGALTATQQTVLKIQGSDDNATWFDLAGTHAGPPPDAAGGGTLISDAYRPGYAYVRPVLVRATANAAIQCVIGDFYLAMLEPVAPDPTNAALTVTAYPKAGTA